MQVPGGLTILVPEHPEARVGQGGIGAEHHVQAGSGGGVGRRGGVTTVSANQRKCGIGPVVKLQRDKYDTGLTREQEEEEEEKLQTS